MKNSKNKGNNFERKIAKILSNWSGLEFHRTPLSGGLHWKNDKRVVSDIVPPQNINFPFSIECKNVNYDWSFDKILEGKGLFWKHWEQAKEDVAKEELHPLLIFTKNYKDIYICIQQEIYNKFSKDTNITLLISRDNEVVLIMSLEQFLSRVTFSNVTAEG